MKKFQAFLAALIACVGLASCSDAGSTAVPRTDRLRSFITTVNGVDLVSVPSRDRPRPASLNAAVIGPSGGSIEVDGARFIVPPGALSQPVMVTMSGRLDDQFRYRFGPTGLRFAVPAILMISVEPAAIGIEGSRLAVAIAPDDTDDWHVIGGNYDPAVGAVAVAVHHFTQYALCQN